MSDSDPPGGDRPDASGEEEEQSQVQDEKPMDRGAFGRSEPPTKAQVKRATRARMCWALASALLLLIAVVFLILVEIGSLRVDHVLNQIYFVRLDLANVVPTSVPDAALINSIAQTLGLHDYYTVGLWGFCYGDNGDGFQACSKPQALYWFDPVKIIESELLAGASISLPTELTSDLKLIRLVSHWMFALFLVGACLTFVMMWIVPVAVYTRWASLPIMFGTFFAALFTTVASVLATALFIIMTNALTSVTELNIGARVGIVMFVFMWIASVASILAWLIQLSLCCCCASRRDVRTGRKRGSRKAWR